jgi:hypothetical protein
MITLELSQDTATRDLEGIKKFPSEVFQGRQIYDYCYHELAAPRYYTADWPYLVVQIGERRFQVFYHVNRCDDMPVKGWLTFHETDEPETPWFETLTKSYVPPKFKYFGQPRFLQYFESFGKDGKAAYPLFVHESGWGDQGNENVFISLDADGYPDGAWWEFSAL